MNLTEKQAAMLVSVLRGVAMNDRTTYEHHEKRPRDGKAPEGGTIWLTPREMAINALRILGEETDSLYFPFRREGSDQGTGGGR